MRYAFLPTDLQDFGRSIKADTTYYTTSLRLRLTTCAGCTFSSIFLFNV